MKTLSISILILMAALTTLGQVAINNDGTDAHPSAMLDIKSTTRGALIPRMTFEQRNAIPDPAEGLMVVCTNCGQTGGTTVSLFLNGTWLNLSANCDLPQPNSTGPHLADTTQVTWTWSPVPIAAGYRIGTTYDFNSAIDVGSDTSYTETGLQCNTWYYRYLMPYNGCGNSYPFGMNALTLPCPITPCAPDFTVSHVAGAVAPVNKTVTYGMVSNIAGTSGTCWLTKNLGAGVQASAVNDNTEESAGWYWQFNRKQGFRHDGTSVTPAWTITVINENLQWVQANDPCYLELGPEWRIPTDTEWGNLLSSGGWGNWTGPWSSGLHMHAAGFLNNENGELLQRGTMGTYWSSTQTSSNSASYLSFTGGSVDLVNNVSKARGASIRCLREAGLPTVSTAIMTSVLQTSANGGGTVEFDGGTAITARGVCWSAAANPTVNDSYTVDGSGLGSFESSVTGLSPGTLYHLRAYATNSAGTAYGEDVTLVTQPANRPVVETVPPTAVTAVSAVAGVTPTSPGGSPGLDQAGICWSTSHNPVVSMAGTYKYIAYPAIGVTYTMTCTLLMPNTTYYVRAFGFNTYGYGYGEEHSFTTLPGTSCSPTITVNHIAGDVAPVSKTVTYEVVTNVPGEANKCWIARNLGASTQAAQAHDTTEASAGWYWQFNTKRGYQHNGNTCTPAWVVMTNWPTTNWQPENDPCLIELGTGWRLPSVFEYANLETAGGWTTLTDAFTSLLKIHAAGRIMDFNGQLDKSVNGWGWYWTSNRDSPGYFWSYRFGSDVRPYDWEPGNGLPVRCVRD